MNNYNNSNGGGFNRNKGKGSFGGGRPSASNGRGDRSGRGGGGRPDRSGHTERPSDKFSATCNACNKACEVPFKPTPGKPVYCSDCFTQKNEGRDSDNRTDRTDRNARPSYDKGSQGRDKDKRSFAGNSSVRAEHPNDRRQTNTSGIETQLRTIEEKLNRILDLINPPVPAVKVAVEEPKVKRTAAAKKVADKPTPKKVVAKAPKTTVTKKTVKKVVAKKTAAKKST